MNLNQQYLTLTENYLFSTINHKVAQYQQKHADTKIIRLGIGDVTKPLAPAIIEALHEAVAEQGQESQFHGYGPEQGYDFLRQAIQEHYQKNYSVALAIDEIFVSDGAKSDLGNVLDLFSVDNVVLIPDPVYPVYVDTNKMAGRSIVYLTGNRENHFLPMPDHNMTADIIYLCSPNNPTGAVYNREQLKAWVDFARQKEAIILFDSAYEAFIDDPALPRSIFEIEGSKECAIEFCSLSKTAGFTGTRCGYTIVPKALIRNEQSLNQWWLRRQTTKFNGVSYIVQKGAAAVFTPQGQQQIKADIAYYQENARLITNCLDELSIYYTGGIQSPYIWLECPVAMDSWAFFDYLLTKAQIVGTPGAGFGQSGERYFRLSAFGKRDDIMEAIARLKKIWQ